MADEVIKKCDFRVGKGRNLKPHGVPVESGVATKWRVDGREYSADLCAEHEAEMMKVLGPFMDIARRTGSSLPKNARGRAVMRAKGGVTFTTKDVRTWLQQQGEEVPATGRIPNAMIEKYKEAHSLA